MDSRETILNDVATLSYGYSIYTGPGKGGGIFIMNHYKPYVNMLTFTELEWLKRKYAASTGEDRKKLERIPHKYGSDKLKLQPD